MALADQLLGGFPYGFLFDVGKRHGCTRLRKRLGGCQPHARTGPGDERNLVVEVGVVVHIRLWFDVISLSEISCFMHRNTPLRLIPMMRFDYSSMISEVVVSGCSTPALLKAKSSCPKFSSAFSSAAFTSSARDTSHLMASARPPSSSISREVSWLPSSETSARALARECHGRCASNAGRRSGHKRNFAGIRSIHF
jgi:hypothetical protein